ncbi:hypothetical protein Kfla_2443 [Kribbella flavida DSM 17836]|uniref:Uncharacterized protein n=1 Tax=Kribbella flavida (strain DSM 17836 / JCM 10339 / NBRC 14399) TaxID=479435 RepID=D2PW65_KRIFD|nr:hypothetical protein [Kribbella flavida]ADB31517.1 hypothetical protein Kfla_2443 [Kribbella flavida DSM 17836]
MSLDQRPSDFDDAELEQAFRRLEAESVSLDSATVVAGGRRRRVRHRIAVGGAAAAATVAVVAGTVAIVPSDRGTEPAIAQQPVTVDAVEAAPVPVIAANQWFKVSAHRWFRHDRTRWQATGAPASETWVHAAVVKAAERSRGWVGPATSGVGRNLESSMLIRGEVQRAVYTVKGDHGTFKHEARVYRLAAMPGWTLAHAEYGAPGPVSKQGLVENLAVGLDAYAADGSRLLHCAYNRPPVKSKAAAIARPPACAAG